MRVALLRAFEILNLFFIGIILVCAVTGTYHNIAWYKVSLVSVCRAVCFAIAFFVLKRLEGFPENMKK